MSTFFSPVLQYFGGAAVPAGPSRPVSGANNDEDAVVMPSDMQSLTTTPTTMVAAAAAAANATSASASSVQSVLAAAGGDSKWETKDDRAPVVSMPPRCNISNNSNLSEQSRDQSFDMSVSAESNGIGKSSSQSSLDEFMSEEEDEDFAAAAAGGGASAANVTTSSSSSSSYQVYPDNNQRMEEEEEDDEFGANDEFNPYAFIKGLPAYSEVVPPSRPRPCLLPASIFIPARPTLVLDLDETLVHCSIDPINNSDLTFNVDFNGTLYDVFVRKRPHFEEFLKHVSKTFEVVVFTASQQGT